MIFLSFSLSRRRRQWLLLFVRGAFLCLSLCFVFGTSNKIVIMQKDRHRFATKPVWEQQYTFAEYCNWFNIIFCFLLLLYTALNDIQCRRRLCRRWKLLFLFFYLNSSLWKINWQTLSSFQFSIFTHSMRLYICVCSICVGFLFCLWAMTKNKFFSFCLSGLLCVCVCEYCLDFVERFFLDQASRKLFGNKQKPKKKEINDKWEKLAFG